MSQHIRLQNQRPEVDSSLRESLCPSFLTVEDGDAGGDITARWAAMSKGEKREGPWDVVDAFAEGGDDAEPKSANSEEYLKSQTHCLHIDGLTVKKCRRMVYRKSGYCYMHQRE